MFGCRWAAVGPGVAIMFLCASFLPSFAPGVVPSRGSTNQVTAGFAVSLFTFQVFALFGTSGSTGDVWNDERNMVL